MGDAGLRSLSVVTAADVSVAVADGAEKPASPPAKPAAASPPPEGGGASPAAAGGAAGREYDADDHLLTLPALAARYGVALDLAHPAASQGLASAAVPALVAKHGRNVLTPPVETPWWVQYLRGFLDPFMLLLLMAGCFCLLASSLLGGVGPPEGWDPINFILVRAAAAVGG